MTETSLLRPLADAPSIEAMLRLVRRHLDMDVVFVGEVLDDQRVVRHVDADPALMEAGHSDPLQDTYCLLVITGELPPVVHDARQHPAVRALPVTAALPVGAHVGVPLRWPDGSLYGTLCAFKTRPDRHLDERDARLLHLVADLVAERLEADAGRDRQRSQARERVSRALAGRQPAIVLQPIVDLRNGCVVGHEALARFDDPARRPDEWFAEAATVGLGVELEVKAARRALALLPDLPPSTYLALNLSAPTLRSPALLAALERAPVRRVVLELTEHDFVEDLPGTRAAVSHLREQGHRLAVDDVGAGYAGLTQLLDLRPDVAKLDRSLITGIDADPVRQALVRAAVAMTDAMGAELVAEGVETDAELIACRELGVARAQGYRVGRPAPWPRRG